MSTTVPTPDGRTLEVLDAGPEDGFPLVFHFGTPSADVPVPFLAEPARARPRPSRAGRLPHDRLVGRRSPGPGVRGAGAHPLPGGGLRRRTRARLGDRLGPPRGMAPANVEEFTAVHDGVEALERFLEGQTAIFGVTAEQLAESLGGLAPEADRAVLTNETLTACFRVAGRQGTIGWRDDDLAMMVRPWGFDLGSIQVPVSVWAGAGAADTMVPFRHGEWLAARVPGAQPRFFAEDGHISLMVKADRILDDLLHLAGLDR